VDFPLGGTRSTLAKPTTFGMASLTLFTWVYNEKRTHHVNVERRLLWRLPDKREEGFLNLSFYLRYEYFFKKFTRIVIVPFKLNKVPFFVHHKTRQENDLICQ
jgi:hypothetical protein